MKRRRVVILLLVLVILAVAGWFGTRFALDLVGVGPGSIEEWCGRQLQALADDHLNPKLSFASLDYDFPSAVTLTDVRLTEGDDDIMRADSLRIEFAKVPRRGEPIVLQTASFDTLVVRLIPQTDGGLAGFADMVKSDGGRTRDDGGSTKLSDVLAIRRIQFKDSGLHYEPPGKPVMRLQPLTFDFSHDPAGAAGVTDPGAYAFDTVLALPPVGRWKMKGRLNFDTWVLDIASSKLDMTLGPEQIQALTPEIQEILNQRQMKGTLVAQTHGQIPFEDMDRLSLDLDVDLSDAHAVLGEVTIPITKLDLIGSIGNGRLDVRKLDVQGFSGTAKLSGHQWLDETKGSGFEVKGNGEGLRLGDVLRHTGFGGKEYEGDIAFQGDVTGDARGFPGSLRGNLELQVTNARLSIVNAFSREFDIMGKRRSTDRAKASISFEADAMSLPKFDIVGDWVAIRGSGQVGYDGRINLVVNAGPLERAQNAMGPIGDVFGMLTDRLVSYHVTGTTAEPKTSIKPLGIGTGK